MTFRAYCPFCEKQGTVIPILAADEFWLAVRDNADVEVMHLSGEGGHRWELNNREKEMLRNTQAKGVYP